MLFYLTSSNFYVVPLVSLYLFGNVHWNACINLLLSLTLRTPSRFIYLSAKTKYFYQVLMTNIIIRVDDINID